MKKKVKAKGIERRDDKKADGDAANHGGINRAMVW